jgi:glyoxylase-like metal-dependent hydrolase (beta-lactamase superfamily II)
MQVIPLTDTRIYSCYAYLILGDWKRLEDPNTLVDIGTTGSIIAAIEKINTGVGKTPVEQVILTHSHFDHAGGLPDIKARYNPRIFAFNHTNGNGGIEKLRDGQVLRVGDREVEVIHIPMHSHDSICLYCREERALFSGDTPLRIISPGGSYPQIFVNALERLVRLNIKTVYSGHDGIIPEAAAMLRSTLQTVQKSLSISK